MGEFGDVFPALNTDNCSFFALGRNAMHAACVAAGIRSGDEILTPAFDCDGTLHPFTAARANVVFYRSNPYTLAIDCDDLCGRITSKTKLIHVINHFGFPQPWNELLRVRNETGIPILEDNAYSLYSRFGEKPLGTMGDMAIFSLRKELPIIDGGVLRINNPQFTCDLPSRSVAWVYPTERRTAISLLQRYVRERLKLPIPFERLAHLIGYLRPTENIIYLPPLYSDPNAPFPDWPERDVAGEDFECDHLRPMSRLARWQVQGWSEEDVEQLKKLRRSAYTYLSDSLRGISGIEIIEPVLAEGVVPFSFNFLIRENRDQVLNKLERRFSLMAWPTLPQAVLDQLNEFPDVQILGRQLLQWVFPKGCHWPADYDNHMRKFVTEIDEFV